MTSLGRLAMVRPRRAIGRAGLTAAAEGVLLGERYYGTDGIAFRTADSVMP